MYRVYDKKNKKWINSNVMLSPMGDLVKINNGFFGKKYKLLSEIRYAYQNEIGTLDKRNNRIYEGDICLSDNGMIGLIVYVPEIAAYVFLNLKSQKYYMLDSFRKHIQVVGNCFENKNLISELDQKETGNEREKE